MASLKKITAKIICMKKYFSFLLIGTFLLSTAYYSQAQKQNEGVLSTIELFPFQQMANASDAVTGPRSSHLNKRLLTTRSGHETPKNATAYAMVMTSPATSRLITNAVLQKASGNRAATPEPNKRYG